MITYKVQISRIIMKDSYVEYLLGIYTLSANDLRFLQMFHQNSTPSHKGDITSTTLSHCAKYVRGGGIVHTRKCHFQQANLHPCFLH